MASKKKVFEKIIQGNADRNIDFDDLCKVLEAFNMNCRIKGSHYIYYKNGIDEIFNLMETKRKRIR